jgi:Ca-activated chloride channel family protein
MRKQLILLFMLISALCAFSDGILIPPSEFIPPTTDHTPRFIMNFHNVKIEIDKGIAKITIEEEFTNPYDYPLEAMYLFPVPPEAVINDFIMKSGDEVLKGNVLPADEARKTYQDIVARIKDPALLEYANNRLIKLSVFPFEPHEKRSFVIEYIQNLEIINETYVLQYPLKIENQLLEPIKNIRIRIIDKNDEIADIFSPTHFLERAGTDNNEWYFEGKNYSPNNDLNLVMTPLEEEISSSSLSYWDIQDNKGYFLLNLIPRIVEKDVIPKDIVFVMDTSGSMSGEKIEQAKKALTRILHMLKTEDRFSIVLFDSDIKEITKGLQSIDNIQNYIKIIEDIQAGGLTNINDALLKSVEILSDVSEKRFKSILFLTDGEPTEGELVPNNIIGNVKNAIGNKPINLFVFGVGYDVNASLLDRLAGDPSKIQYVEPGEYIDEKVSALFTKIETPALNDVHIEINGPQIDKIVPGSVSTLFADTAFRIGGLFKEPGKLMVTITGTRGEKEHTYVYSFDLTMNYANNFVSVLWAQKRIAQLADRYRYDDLNEAQKTEIENEIISLSKKYNIINEFTSYLIAPDKFTEETEFRNVTGTGMSYASKVSPDKTSQVKSSKAVSEMAQDQIQEGEADFVFIDEKLFTKDESGVWYQEGYEDSENDEIIIKAYSEVYFHLMNMENWVMDLFLLGNEIRFIYNDYKISITEEGIEEIADLPEELK